MKASFLDGFDEAQRALKETISNLERLVQQAERVLKRAKERLAALEEWWPSSEDF